MIGGAVTKKSKFGVVSSWFSSAPSFTSQPVRYLTKLAMDIVDWFCNAHCFQLAPASNASCPQWPHLFSLSKNLRRAHGHIWFANKLEYTCNIVLHSVSACTV